MRRRRCGPCAASETRPVVTFWNALPSCSRSEGLRREECVGEEQEAAGGREAGVRVEGRGKREGGGKGSGGVGGTAAAAAVGPRGAGGAEVCSGLFM